MSVDIVVAQDDTAWCMSGTWARSIIAHGHKFAVASMQLDIAYLFNCPCEQVSPSASLPGLVGWKYRLLGAFKYESLLCAAHGAVCNVV